MTVSPLIMDSLYSWLASIVTATAWIRFRFRMFLIPALRKTCLTWWLSTKVESAWTMTWSFEFGWLRACFESTGDT